MAKTRIPAEIAAFDVYINNTDDYNFKTDPLYGANWERLGITSANATAWNDKRLYWRDTLYVAYKNPLTVNSAVRLQVKNFIRSFQLFGMPLLNTMAPHSNATEKDEKVYRFKRRHKKRTRPTIAITEQCYASAAMKGGSEFKYTCRTSHDIKRASLAAGADSVQMAYKIGTPAPASPEDGTVKEIFTRSTFVHQAGVENIGKKLYRYFRWYNTKHPELAGPWSDLQTGLIA